MIKTPQYELHLGDCRQVLSTFEKNSIDAVVCDPPYGLSHDPDTNEMLNNWLDNLPYEHSDRGGFMGKDWDSFVPGPEYWDYLFRVMKPGAWLLAMSSTRTWDLLSIAIRLAGFQNRDTIGIPTLAWMHGQGFPKGKAALKPAWEVILVFRKPLAGTLEDNVDWYGTGELNIDESRIETDEMLGRPQADQHFFKGLANNDWNDNSTGKGRWPANVMLLHTPFCECIGTRKVKTPTGDANYTKTGIQGSTSIIANVVTGAHHGDENGEEDQEQWDCHPYCQVAELDQQSGQVRSSGLYEKGSLGLEYQGSKDSPTAFGVDGYNSPTYGDIGTAARFFYTAKASTDERNVGTKTTANRHTTVKPLKLIDHLIKLVTPKDGIILDPFMGSGSTGCSAVRLGYQFIGIEKDEESFTTASERIAYWAKKVGR